MADRPVRTLLIEDDREDYLITRDLFAEIEGTPFELHWVSTFEEGRVALARGDYDVYLLDYRLGAQDGLQLLAEALAGGCDSPIIVLTGRGGRDVDMDAMRAGAADYLVKGQIDATALDRCLRFAIQRKRTERAQRLLADVARTLTESLDFSATLEQLARTLVPRLADWCTIDLLGAANEVERVEVAHRGTGITASTENAGQTPDPTLGNLVAGVLRTGSSALVEVVTDEWLRGIVRSSQHFERLQSLPIRSLMVVPLVARGHTLGAISLVSAESGRHYTPEDLALAEELAGRAALAVDNARLYRDAKAAEEETRRHAARLQLLSDASRIFAEAVPRFDVLLTTIVRQVAELLDAECTAHLLSADGQQLEAVAGHHIDPQRLAVLRERLASSRQRATEGLTGYVLATGEPMRPPAHPETLPLERIQRELWPFCAADELPAILIVPLRSRGRVIGTLAIARALTTPFVEDEQLLLQDLADRAALAIDNARLYSESQHSIAMRDDVLAIVSHDLRNPLNTILSSASLLLELPLGPAEAQQQYAIIRRTAQRMNTLIQDLVEVARIEAGSLSVELQSVPTLTLLEEACEAHQQQAHTRGLQIERRAATDLPPLLADRGRILQVLSNLIGNAIKFTPPGGRITIGAVADGDQVTFSVADTGPGIAPEDLTHVFERFWQARRADRAGAGLGLAISKGIVEAHGGRIWVESTVGAGTVFHFVIPAVLPQVDQSHTPSARSVVRSDYDAQSARAASRR